MATDGRWTRRDFFLRLGAGAVVAGGGSLILGACSRTEPTGGSEGGTKSLLDKLKSEGTITVGFAGEVPYAYNDGGELTGQAPALHKAIWKAEGIDEVKGVKVDFDQLIPGLNARRFDAVAAGMFILPDRCEKAAFSDPEYVAAEAFLVPKGNPKNIKTYDDVKKTGIKLGVMPGTSERQYVKDLGIADSKITEIASQRDALAALEAKRIDAFSLTSISLNNIMKENPDVPYEVTEGFIPVINGEEQIGAGASVFRTDDASTPLLEAYNKHLGEMRKSGELLKLIEPFGFGKETIPDDDVTTESLCNAG